MKNHECGVEINILLFIWTGKTVFSTLIIVFLIRQKGLKLKYIAGYFSFKKPNTISVTSITILVCASAFFISLFTVPYNWDSMSYHLTRIAH